MIIKYEMEIENLSSEMEKAEFKSLIKDGYSIVSTLPVIDNNNPVLILFLEQKQVLDVLEVQKAKEKQNKHQLYFYYTVTLLIIINTILNYYN